MFRPRFINNLFTVKTNYSTWEWGDEEAVGDAEWWAGLKEWIVEASDEDLQACVGKTKSVTLTSAVLDTTTHLVRCIGANQDGDKTLTFQTDGTLNQNTYYSDIPSNISAYYDAFPGKNSIKQVSKCEQDEIIGDPMGGGSNTLGPVTYTDRKVWIPSIHEMGFPDTTENNALVPQYTSGNSQPYSYYTSNDSRIKNNNYYFVEAVYFTRTISTLIGIQVNVYSISKRGTSLKAGWKPAVDVSVYLGLAPAFVIG